VSEQPNKPLPDALCHKSDDPGSMPLVANKRARRVLNKAFEKPRPQRRKVTTIDGCLTDHRAIEVGKSAALCAMLCALHDAHLEVLYWCEDCGNHHPLEDEDAKRLWYIAISGAEGVMPAHKSVQ
jgi:hypothetical protein